MTSVPSNSREPRAKFDAPQRRCVLAHLSPLTLPGLLRQRKSLEKVQRASAQIADFGEKVADSPAKRKDAKAITLAGVRTVNELAKRLAPSLYMEHLLRALQVADDHFASGARNLSPIPVVEERDAQTVELWQRWPTA